ncbi:mini-chromosome maintenance complex-binding protein isoform X2 [Pseudoliparis swirei]|uniref:mini-chromosome maintenance complex-binding protein isoform X2 n=1 Tax=Pseudoliparis swirei TaxID=2059687 RepID=UPI0024BECDF9|nr:mini-chromosome maintenance complex-binding protein isoform X2 [Pseudoliparis swirei]
MPSTDDWIHNPLGVVEGMFAASQNVPDSGWEAKAVAFFKDRLEEKDAHTRVPSLNDVPLHYLPPGSLVRFRCFIQDMFDPEFYTGAYEAADPTTGAKVLRCGKYRDVTDCAVDFNSGNTLTAERRTFYCVPIPGENPWAKEGFAASSRARVAPSTSYAPTRQKRSYEEDDDDDMDTQPQTQPHTGPQSPTEARGNGDCKRREKAAPCGPAAAPAHLDLNFPLPGEKGPSCLLKVYEERDGFTLNEAVEVFGILSVSPALGALADGDASSSLLDPAGAMETAEEQRVHSPPASLVPRLHMLHATPLPHGNPLLPAAGLEDGSACSSPSPGELSSARAELLSFLSGVLLGDALAAEYLILHLVSNVYTRRDVLPLGKFTLNLSGCPAAFPERLYRALRQLVPSSYYLAMTLQNMNQVRLVPTKDYGANRLRSGALQLARNTSLFLDESRLEQGQLDPTGVRNITALGTLISWQKVDYDFSFHTMEFSCNVNVIIASEGRSLLPAVEDDFVAMRKEAPQSVSPEDLHRMLVVARLLSVSRGHTSLSPADWLRAKQLELLRRSRTPPPPRLNEP